MILKCKTLKTYHVTGSLCAEHVPPPLDVEEQILQTVKNRYW